MSFIFHWPLEATQSSGRRVDSMNFICDKIYLENFVSWFS